MEMFLFLLFAGIALAGALGVVLSPNPVHSALSLVTVLIAIAALFVIQDAQLLAAVQVIVYAGAIVVLFLFVIMLLGVDRSESTTGTLRIQRPAAIVLGGFDPSRYKVERTEAQRLEFAGGRDGDVAVEVADEAGHGGVVASGSRRGKRRPRLRINSA